MLTAHVIYGTAFVKSGYRLGSYLTVFDGELSRTLVTAPSRRSLARAGSTDLVDGAMALVAVLVFPGGPCGRLMRLFARESLRALSYCPGLSVRSRRRVMLQRAPMTRRPACLRVRGD